MPQPRNQARRQVKNKQNNPPQNSHNTGKVSPQKNKKSHWLWLLGVLLVTTIAFTPTLQNEFIETWDDGVYVTDNMTITGLGAHNITTMFTTPVNGTYVPIPLLSLALEYHFFTLNPRPYHVNNLLLHLLCTTLVFYVLILLNINPWFAAFGALLFGVHPMRVESVAWVTERKDLLFSLFYLSALVSHIFYILKPHRKTLFYSLTLLFFLLSLFSKIQAVTLPLTLLLLDYYLRRDLSWKLLLEKIPHFALSLGFGLAGVFILEKTGSLEINAHYSLFERIMFGMQSLWIYILKLFYPHPLSAYYPYPMSPGKALPWHYYLSLILLATIAFAVYMSRKKTRAVVFGSLFFLVNVMFLLQILGAGQAFMADRFTYIPYLGFFFLAAWSAQQLSMSKPAWKMTLVVLMILIPSIHFALTRQRCTEWKNSETLWTCVIEDFPEKVPTAYANRASYYRKLGEWPKATRDYDISIRLDPNNAVSIMNRGNLYFDMGNIDAAYQDYIIATQKRKAGLDLDRLYANFGAVYGMRQQYDSALYYLNLSLALDSLFPNAFLNRALIYEKTARPEEAIRDYKNYLRFRPEDERVYSSIGVNLQALKKYDESIHWFTEGIKRNPGSGVHYNNRSYSYNALGNIENARSDARKALENGHPVSKEYLAFIGIQ